MQPYSLCRTAILSRVYNHTLRAGCATILSGVYSHTLRGIQPYSQGYTAVLAGVCSHILRGVQSYSQGYTAIHSGVCSHTLRGVQPYSQGYTAILAGVCSHILRGVQSYSQGCTAILSVVCSQNLRGVQPYSQGYAVILSGVYSHTLSRVQPYSQSAQGSTAMLSEVYNHRHPAEIPGNWYNSRGVWFNASVNYSCPPAPAPPPPKYFKNLIYIISEWDIFLQVAQRGKRYTIVPLKDTSFLNFEKMAVSTHHNPQTDTEGQRVIWL